MIGETCTSRKAGSKKERMPKKHDADRSLHWLTIDCIIFSSSLPMSLSQRDIGHGNSDFFHCNDLLNTDIKH